MNEKTKTIIAYCIDRMDESSTWQGLGFILTLCGAKWATNLDWGAAAALGGFVSGLIKTIFPDTLK